MIFFIPVVYSVEGVKEDHYFLAIRISWLGKQGSGEGMGFGAKAKPSAVIVIQKGQVQLLGMKSKKESR